VPDEDDRHLDASDVDDLLAGKSTKDDTALVGHLRGGCEACRELIRRRVLEARDATAADDAGDAGSDPAFDAAYDAAFDAAVAKSAVLLGARLADLEAGALLWAGLREQPPGRRLTLVLNSRKYRTAGVLEALFREYRDGLWRDAGEGLAVAELGLAIAERLDPDRYRASWLADLQGEALAIAGNAKRLACCSGEAGQLLRQAARKLRVGSGDALLEARVVTYLGGHWQTLRRFKKAAQAFGHAEQVYRGVGELHQAARSLVARAEAIGYLHPEQGVRLLRRAIPEIDGERDPHLELTAHHNLAWYLNDAGQGWEARAEVGRSAGLYERFTGDAVASLSRVWLAGRIDRSLHELDRARRSYERAWAGFEDLGMQRSLTMVAIDRAELGVAEGEDGGAAALLARMLALVESWGVSRETRMVLRMLHEAVVSRQSKRAAFRQASLAVRRWWETAETGDAEDPRPRCPGAAGAGGDGAG
jgi:hypothetical protein